MGWTFYNSSGEAMIIDGGVSASAAVFTGQVDLGSNLLVGNGGSTGIAISSAGEVTMAAQPAFQAYNSVEELNVTGNGATVTVDFDTEVFDQNADFASDTFTAPTTGRYQLNGMVSVDGITSSAVGFVMTIVTSNRSYIRRGDPSENSGNDSTYAFSFLVDMDGADTATVTFQGEGESSNLQDINAGVGETTFSGWLAV
jgi:hypothetical protein